MADDTFRALTKNVKPTAWVELALRVIAWHWDMPAGVTVRFRAGGVEVADLLEVIGEGPTLGEACEAAIRLLSDSEIIHALDSVRA